MSCISKNDRPSWFAPTAAIPPLEAELLMRYYAPNIFMFFFALFFRFRYFDIVRHGTHRLSSYFQYMLYNHLNFAEHNKSPRFEISLKSGALWRQQYVIMGNCSRCPLIIQSLLLVSKYIELISSKRIPGIRCCHKFAIWT